MQLDHFEQAIAFFFSENDPTWQDAHDRSLVFVPFSLTKVPIVQLDHSEHFLAFFEENNPTSHSVQDKEASPKLIYFPASHIVPGVQLDGGK